MKQLIILSISDFKLMFRDPSLRIFLFFPILIYLVINHFMPFLISKFEVVKDYVAYVLVVASIENIQMFGFIYSMVLIDEKESEVAKIYGVLPVSKFWFIIFRLMIPMLMTSLLTWFILMLQPFYDLSPFSLFICSILAGFIVPVYVIGITNFSKNRMEGMVWIKVFNVIVILPIAAFFIQGPFQHLFGIFPTYWAFQGLYNIIYDNPFLWQVGIGFLYFGVLLYITAQKFSSKHFI